MKAPDKIYINGFSAFATVPVKEGIEYIRKEALMELINKKLQESADRLDYRTNKAYAEIRDILNEK